MASLVPFVRTIDDFQVRRAGIIVKKDNVAAADYAHRLQGWLEQRSIETSLNELTPELDLGIILGGDGTLLHIAETAARYEVPVIGINLGHLGFLTELTEREAKPALLAIIGGAVTMEYRSMLKTRLVRNGEPDKYRYALNDVVISKNAADRLLYLSTQADHDYITTYKADGLIMSTPTGSTAYSLSAGGPLVHPGLDTILVTPICPFMLSSRPIILPADKTISSMLQADEAGSAADIIVDGQKGWEMRPGDTLEVAQAEHPLHLIVSTEKDYFTILRNKLKWGSDT
ncbi:MAG: NAD(+)/NADH kinase [Desulfofustis sp.]|nr:NAD(+)/NADH kinase [Desulfofustis sp.]